MTRQYARQVQIPTGVMQARDLDPGDKLFSRTPGSRAFTVQTVINTARVHGDVALALSDGTHRLYSPHMPVRLA